VELFPLPVLRSAARVLKLLDGCVLCWRCCHRRGARYRVWRSTLRQRAERRIAKLRSALGSETSLRLKPGLWGRLERRSRLEMALARCEYVVSRASRRFRDVQAEEIPLEPIARPKVKTTR
jgi:hypothetical protein